MAETAGEKRLSTAGFVLAGGNSSRMGRDKALLSYAGHTLVEEVAAQVKDAVGSVTIIGSQDRYGHLGIPVVEDILPGNGPLGGLYTALSAGKAEWSLIVACDLPGVRTAFLRELLDAALRFGSDALVPRTNKGWEPLCAVYRQNLSSTVHAYLERKELKMQAFLDAINAEAWDVKDPAMLANLNSPKDLPEGWNISA